MTQTQTQTQQQKGPDLKALGLKSPMEVIDILSLLKIDGEPIILDDKLHLDPKAKAQAVVDFFTTKLGAKANELPYLAAAIKRKLKNGQMTWRRN